MIVKPQRPVLNRESWQARGLVGAWPLLLSSAAGAVEPSLTGKNNMGKNHTLFARNTSPFGRGSTLTPTGVTGAGTSTLKTSTIGGVVPAFPMTAWLVARATPGLNTYMFGRWNNSWDWLIASINPGLLYIYQGNAGTNSYRYWQVGTIAMTSWRALSVSFTSVTATPIVRTTTATGRNVVVPITVGMETGPLGLIGFTQGTAEIGINSSYGDVLSMDVADARVWNYAMTDAQQSQLHNNPWELYSPRGFNGLTSAEEFASPLTSRAFYYRNFVASRGLGK